MKIPVRGKSTENSTPTRDAATIRNQQRKPARSPTPSTEFGRTLRDLLGKTFKPSQVNEEELFAATTHQLILNRYGEDVAEDFKSAFRLNMTDKPSSEKFASPERAAKESLRFFVNATLLTKEEARQIRQLAFTTSQLDDNLDFVWDSLGDTKAITSFAAGEKLVQGRLEASGNAPIIASRRGRGGVTSPESGYTTQATPKPPRGRGSVKRSA